MSMSDLELEVEVLRKPPGIRKQFSYTYELEYTPKLFNPTAEGGVFSTRAYTCSLSIFNQYYVKCDRPMVPLGCHP